MTRATIGRYVSWAVAALAAAGCFKLARTSPPVERYVLGGIRPAATAVKAATAAVAADSASFSVGLRRLDLAPYLATLAIVVRRADNEIVTTGFHRWAEGPSAGLNRAVSGYLAAAPGIRSIDVAPWPVRSTHDYIVQIHVTRLEGIASEIDSRRGEAHLLARWEIIRPADGALIARGITDHRALDWVVDDYPGLVMRLDRGLVVLAKDLVACLVRLGPPPAALDTATATGAREAPMGCGAR